MNLSPTEIYNDRKIFLIGSTGFLGKVTLSMLLHSFPNIGRVYVTVRARSQEESEIAFLEQRDHRAAFRSSARTLRQRAWTVSFATRCVVLGGDIGETNLGYTEEAGPGSRR